MDELLSQIDFSFSDDFSIPMYVINILISTLLLYILSVLYRRFGNSISNRNQLSNVLILVGVTTFIIISIVKSSLALSLGLVGALSIIRFRTAIKEPEELGYFFIAISIGLGMGANQLLPTVIGFIILAMIIVYMGGIGSTKSLTQNLILHTSLNGRDGKDLIEKINSVVEDQSRQVELKRLNQGDGHLDINYLVNVKSLERLQSLSSGLQALDNDMKITFIDNEI